MELLPIYIVLALAASSCIARSHSYLDVNIDNVKKKILEYKPDDVEPRDQESQIAEAAHSLALRMFHDRIQQAETVAADPIPAVAEKLGLTELVTLVVKAGLKDALEGTGPFTVFGPTNEAFTKLPEWAKKAVSNVTVLAEVLKFHVLPGKIMSSSLQNDLLAPTLVTDAKVRINIYKKSAGTVATAQCAPIDLSRVDQGASNGVVHVLNRVMLPPAGDIVTALSACPAFKTLVKAVGVAKLVDTLKGEGPFTVFAPTDKAFKKLPPGTVEELLKNPTKLAKILTYHVVTSTQCSAGLMSGPVKTAEGQDVDVKVTAEGVTVGGAKVISADGSVSNGVIHAIDTVLLPPTF